MTNPPLARTVAGDLDRVLAYTLSMVDWAQMYNTDPDSFDLLRRLLEVDLPDAIEDAVRQKGYSVQLENKADWDAAIAVLPGERS